MNVRAAQPEAINQADADAALDRSVLAELREFTGADDPTMIERLVALFLDEARGHIQEIGEARDMRSARRVARAAHQLHGSAGFVGATGLMSICADVERRADHGVLDGLDLALRRLDRALDALRPCLLDLSRPPAAGAPRLARTA
jgi:HPt (histidine-containing phosphotransfer) domain-containing protein